MNVLLINSVLIVDLLSEGFRDNLAFLLVIILFRKYNINVVITLCYRYNKMLYTVLLFLIRSELLVTPNLRVFGRGFKHRRIHFFVYFYLISTTFKMVKDIIVKKLACSTTKIMKTYAIPSHREKAWIPNSENITRWLLWYAIILT